MNEHFGGAVLVRKAAVLAPEFKARSAIFDTLCGFGSPYPIKSL